LLRELKLTRFGLEQDWSLHSGYETVDWLIRYEFVDAGVEYSYLSLSPAATLSSPWVVVCYPES
jgi:hypothetical protein